MIVTIVIGLLILYVIYSWLNMKPKNYPPGPPCLPFVGSVLSMPKSYLHLKMMEWRKTYGPLVGFMFGPAPLVAVCDPRTVLEVLKRDEFQMRPDTFMNRSRTFNKRLGVFSADGPVWVEQRRFTLRNLRDLGFGKTSEEGIMHDEVGYVIKKLESLKVASVSGLFTLSFVNVLWVVLSGTRIDEKDEKFQSIFNNIFETFRSGDPSGGLVDVLPVLRFVLPFLGGFKTQMDTINEMHDLFQNIISEHEKTLVPESPRDFIDVYIREKQLQQTKEGSTFTDEALIVTCSDLLVAGTESTANTLSFALLYLVLYPEKQKKVHEELDRVVGRNRLVSLADRHNLPYVEAFIAETMRCNTIAPITPPHRADRDTLLNGYFIPKDSMMVISLWSVLKDEDHWGDPENFRPERFLSPDGKFVKDDWMANFGMGKRVCLGESLARNSLFIFFTCLLQRLSFSVPPGDSEPSTLALTGITGAPQPFRVKVKTRE